jgi:hypothetical protein
MQESDLIKKIGSVRPLTQGADSHVSLFNNETNKRFVLKEYKKLAKNVGEKNVGEILSNYYKDTQRAMELLRENPNPLRQTIRIGQDTYSLYYEIIPQGGIILEDKDGESNKKVRTSFGQDYISGLNLLTVATLPIDTQLQQPYSETQGIFIDNTPLYNELLTSSSELFDYLSSEIDSYFTFSAANIKPFLDKKNKKLVIKITDLCALLSEYFNKSKKFETLRQKTQF